ncbi:hypothetical protein H6P81_019829 [Aristolochia fimbriata]|uniref:Uncharacterized protein n=1 Tax=Aristolochia fimbriata TaxID=158543 RepID=A0AAV7DTQ0_ARIFI|nr:hypothetical protein H6P81_019829 [Aristolochia fimbriata]
MLPVAKDLKISSTHPGTREKVFQHSVTCGSVGKKNFLSFSGGKAAEDTEVAVQAASRIMNKIETVVAAALPIFFLSLRSPSNTVLVNLLVLGYC